MTKKIKLPLIWISLLLLMSILASCATDDTYQVTFDTGTDTIIEPIEAKTGEAIFAPSNPSREGYRFDGWMLDDQAFSFGVMPDKDIELVAKWSRYYQINFDPDGGSDVSSIFVAEGDEIPYPDAPKKSHYKFQGWLYLEEPFLDEVMPSRHLTLVASWAEATTISFSASVYDRHLGSMVTIDMEEMVELSGTEISAPIHPTYPEYKFLHWTLNGEVYDFETMPDDDIELTAEWLELSNLPALFINLHQPSGQVIPIEHVTRELYVQSTISLENTDASFVIDPVSAEFKGRGNGSWIDSGEKRGFRIKFEDKQSLLGNPESRHWVILAGANFDDVTMFRNKLAFDMTNELFTHIGYASTADWVDVYINGEYRGVYLLAEHLRVDPDRVDIETVYGVLDTGYLIEYDSYASGTNGVDYFRVDGVRYPFTMKSPSPDDFLEEGLTLEQYKAHVSYIQEMVQEMVTGAMTKNFELFSTYADVDSFVDMYLLHELFKNIDTGFSSFFIYRHAGSKLYAGPPWDFDATLGSTPSRGNGSPMGIFVGLAVQAFSSRTASEFLISLYATPDFKEVIVSRWQEISPDIQTYVDDTLTESMVETYQFAMGRNFVRWPSPQGYGAPVSQETAEANWIANIDKLRKWLTDRINWLNQEWV